MIIWKPEYNVGIEKIDGQHKSLFEILNVLNAAVEVGNKTEADWYTVRLLRYYSDFHCNFEEELMEKYQYPDLEKHKIEHKKFRIHVRGLKKDFPDDKVLLATKVKEFVEGWIIDHILGTDKKYSLFLIDKIENNSD